MTCSGISLYSVFSNQLHTSRRHATPLLTKGDHGARNLIVIHAHWLSLGPVMAVTPTLAALVTWRSWQSSTLTELMHDWSWMVSHHCFSTHHSLTDILNYIPLVQNCYCHWKFPMIHEDRIFLNSRNAVIFQLYLLVGISKEWTQKYLKNVWMTLIMLIAK